MRRSELRELLLLQQGHQRRQEREDARTLALVNHIRGFAGADPLDSLFSTSPTPSSQDQDAIDAMKYRWRDWFEEDATD